MNEPHGEETLFAGALCLPPEERAAYLDQAVGGDAALRRRIEALLNAAEQSGTFLEDPAAPAARATRTASLPIAEKAGDKIGRYKLLQQIGEGGCGVVYMAEQEEPVRRRVALKIIKLGMDTKQVIARFEAERQALAMMDHPNIARVLDAGATETGRPYFVMELVRGVKITDFCDQKNLTTRERLELFMQVCRAIQHAHQKGIIHRDIKPSNILVTLHDGVPVPKVIDFGIAKATQGRLTNLTVFTAFELFIGTPAYMSPEQAEMSGLDIDTRSDIYSLGVLLYELLTSQTPFDGKQLLASGLAAMRRTILEQEPVRPSTRLTQELAAAGVVGRVTPCAPASGDNNAGDGAHGVTRPTPKTEEEGRADSSRLLRWKETITLLRGDLDWIVMRCLEKDRARRYETAIGLAADLQRHLNQEPVLACPPGKLYRIQKLVRRHKLAFAAAGAVAFALLAGTLVSGVYAVQAGRAEKAASAERLQALADRDRARNAERQASEDRVKAQEAEAEAKAVNDFLQQDLLRQAGTDRQAESGIAVDPNITLRQVVDRAAARLDNRFTNQPLVEASIHMTLAEIYDVMGDPVADKRHAERAVELRERILGPEHPLTLAAMSALTGALSGAEGVVYDEKTLERLQAVLGREHPDTLKCMDTLGMAYMDVGRFNEAVALLEESLKLHKARLGPQDPGLMGTQFDLGRVYQAMGRLDQALPLLEETFKVEKSTLGPDHPLTLSTMGELAITYQDAGRLNDALRLTQENLSLLKAKLGPEHPDTLTSMNNLAGAYEASGRLNEALPLYEETLRLRKAKLGPEHPDTLWSMNNLAVAYDDSGRLNEARPLYEETLKLRKAKLGPEHPDTLTSMHNLAMAYEASGRLNEARPLYEETLRLRKAKLGPEHPDTLRSMGTLASAYLEAGRLNEALSLFEETLKLEKSKLSPDHPDTLRVMDGLASAYQNAGRLSEALSLFEKTLRLRKSKLGPDHPHTLQSMFNLAEAYRKTGRLSEGLALYEETLKLQKIKFGPEHPYTLTLMGDLAGAYEEAGRLNEALPLYEESVKLQKIKLGPGHPETVTSMNSLAQAYQKAGRGAEAERVFSDVLTPAFASRPESSRVLQSRANFHARCARWKEAAADLSHALELRPEAHFVWHSLAAVLVQSGELNAYREHCRKSIERFGNTTDPVIAERIAKDCLILPDSGADLVTVARMTQTALTSTNYPSDPAWPQLAQSLADYREGHFTNAADWAGKALHKLGTDSERDVEACMVQALAWQGLSQSDKARAALARGRELAATKLPKLEDGDVGGNWLDWIIAQALLREAGSTIEGRPVAARDAGK